MRYAGPVRPSPTPRQTPVALPGPTQGSASSSAALNVQILPVKPQDQVPQVPLSAGQIVTPQVRPSALVPVGSGAGASVAQLGNAVVAPDASETVRTRHHEAPRYIYGSGRSTVMEKAPVINHRDEELILLESLVGRVPAFLQRPTDEFGPKY